jgi:hypothetical protein
MKYLVIILICLFAIPAFSHEPIEYGYPVVVVIEQAPEYVAPEPVDTSVDTSVEDSEFVENVKTYVIYDVVGWLEVFGVLPNPLK